MHNPNLNATEILIKDHLIFDTLLFNIKNIQINITNIKKTNLDIVDFK
jgi:hypothetical protein